MMFEEYKTAVLAPATLLHKFVAGVFRMKRRKFLQNTTLAFTAIAGTGYADVANVLALSPSNKNKLTPFTWSIKAMAGKSDV